MLGPETAEQARGLVPDEFLERYKKGEFLNPVAEPKPGTHFIDPNFMAEGNANRGKYTVNEIGTIIDPTTGKQPTYIYGPPFPDVDKNDPQAGVKLVHVPYKGEGAAHLDLFGGTLDIAWANSGTARTLLNSNRIKVLGATGSRRSQVLAQTPLFGEQGFDGFEPTTWIGAYAPGRTPPAIVDELSAALRKATRQPDIAARWRDIGFEPAGTTPEEFARIHKADFLKWAQMIEAAGVTAE